MTGNQFLSSPLAATMLGIICASGVTIAVALIKLFGRFTLLEREMVQVKVDIGAIQRDQTLIHWWVLNVMRHTMPEQTGVQESGQ